MPILLLLLVTSCTSNATPPTETATTTSPETGSTGFVARPGCVDEDPFTTYDNQTPGPFFVCSITAGPLITGGRVFERAEVGTAEEAIVEWAKGPTADESALGYGGWNLAQFEWFLPAVSFSRAEDVLIMDVDHWEPINNLSTSNGRQEFITTLLGTAFSDSSVESFVLVILGDSCPQIGDGEICFPISRNQFLSGQGG